MPEIMFQHLLDWRTTTISLDWKMKNVNCIVIVIMDRFFKLIGLYPAKSTTSKEYVHALLQLVSIFGVLKEIRSDMGSQFTSKTGHSLMALLRPFSCSGVSSRSERNHRRERYKNTYELWCMKRDFAILGAIICHWSNELSKHCG